MEVNTTHTEQELLAAYRAETLALEAHERAVHEVAVAIENKELTSDAVYQARRRLDAARKALRASYSAQWAEVQA